MVGLNVSEYVLLTSFMDTFILLDSLSMALLTNRVVSLSRIA